MYKKSRNRIFLLFIQAGILYSPHSTVVLAYRTKLIIEKAEDYYNTIFDTLELVITNKFLVMNNTFP